jgi:hypothetical protein
MWKLIVAFRIFSKAPNKDQKSARFLLLFFFFLISFKSVLSLTSIRWYIYAGARLCHVLGKLNFCPNQIFLVGFPQYPCRNTYASAINFRYTAQSVNRDLEYNVGLQESERESERETMTGASVIAKRRCAVLNTTNLGRYTPAAGQRSVTPPRRKYSLYGKGHGCILIWQSKYTDITFISCNRVLLLWYAAVGWDSSVSIATCYWLDGPEIKSR